MKVALIDDDELFCALMENLLPACGIQNIELFNDGPEALHAWAQQTQSERPQLLFLDINLPSLTGWEILQTLAQDFPHMRVYMLVASHNKQDIERAQADPHVAGLLQKPVQLPALKEVFQNL